MCNAERWDEENEKIKADNWRLSRASDSCVVRWELCVGISNKWASKVFVYLNMCMHSLFILREFRKYVLEKKEEEIFSKTSFIMGVGGFVEHQGDKSKKNLIYAHSRSPPARFWFFSAFPHLSEKCIDCQFICAINLFMRATYVSFIFFMYGKSMIFTGELGESVRGWMELLIKI